MEVPFGLHMDPPPSIFTHPTLPFQLTSAGINPSKTAPVPHLDAYPLVSHPDATYPTLPMTPQPPREAGV
eukprot:118695-Hanusia_phi.AAC.9